MAKTNRKSVKLPRDIEHGCVWLTARNYVRWQVTINGRTRVSECKDRDGAFDAMRKAIIALQSAPNQDEPYSENGWQQVSIRDWRDEVIDHRAPHLEPTTRDLYRWLTTKWVLSYNDWTPIGQINKPWVTTLRAKLIDALFASEMSWHHYRNITTAFGLCLREAFDADLVNEDLSLHLRLKKPERKKLVIEGRITSKSVKGRRYVKNEDWVTLLHSFTGHWLYGPLLLGSFTGMRTAEVAGLTWVHVHSDEPVPYITVAKQIKRIRGKGLTEKSPKYNSVGEIGLVGPVVEMLHALPKRSAYVFVNSRGNPLDVSLIDQVLKDKVQKLGITCLDGCAPVFTDLARRALSTERRRAGISPEQGAAVARHAVAMQEYTYEQESRQDEEVRKDGLATLSAIYSARLQELEEFKGANPKEKGV